MCRPGRRSTTSPPPTRAGRDQRRRRSTQLPDRLGRWSHEDHDGPLRSRLGNGRARLPLPHQRQGPGFRFGHRGGRDDVRRGRCCGSQHCDQYLADFVVVDADGPSARCAMATPCCSTTSVATAQSKSHAPTRKPTSTSSTAGPTPDVFYAGMLQYDGDAMVPKQYLVEPPAIDRTVSESCAPKGCTVSPSARRRSSGTSPTSGMGTARVTSTPRSRLHRGAPATTSNSITTPAMKVREITAEVIDLLRTGEYQFGRLNFPSGDMVGHTGNLVRPSRPWP